jgi:lysyl-tRNA synthetase class 2
MKKLLGCGYERIYALGKVWRAGEITERHNVEFTLLEWYRAGFGAGELMDETEALVRAAVPADKVPDTPFRRWRVADAFRACAGIDFDALAIDDAAAFAEAARTAGVRVPDTEPWDDIFNRVHLELLEPHLQGAVFLYDYPLEQAVLARRSPSAPRYAERFELFVDGLELCNGFAELTDPVEQRARFVAEQAARRALGKPAYPLDEDFLTALATMPESAGNALGIDRLVMLALGAATIGEVMAFATPRLFRVDKPR